jgi:RimJ/RimL family protein N-acetyltransferase
MPIKIRSLTPGDTAAVERLLNMNATDAYPHELVTGLQFDELLATDSEWMADCAVVGAFRQDELLAAAKIGRNPADGEPRDLGNMLPGDGVIEWLLLSDEDAADELLDFAAPTLGTRWYAFPESGELGRFAPFHTGMLPIQRKPITAFFEKRGWEQPVSETWGRQERIAYRFDITGPIDVAPLPPGLQVQHDARMRIKTWIQSRMRSRNRTSFKTRIQTSDGTRVGKCSFSSVTLRGETLDDAIYAGWMEVDEEWRGQGVGRTLLFMQMSRAQQMGMNRIYCTTHVDSPAWQLYERMGYREVMRLKSWVKNL